MSTGRSRPALIEGWDRPDESFTADAKKRATRRSHDFACIKLLIPAADHTASNQNTTAGWTENSVPRADNFGAGVNLREGTMPNFSADAVVKTPP
jgi:hypothetical protein